MLKRVLLVISVALLLLAPQVLSGKSYAVLVGISNYGDKRMNLKCPASDVMKMRKAMMKNGVRPTTITSRYATRKQVIQIVKDVAKQAGAEDKLFFYFAGHGREDQMVMADRQMFHYSELVDILVGSQAKETFCFIDACHSGSVNKLVEEKQGWIQAEQPRKSINFMMACRDTESAGESSWIGNGFFSKALIKGIGGLADANGDGQLTLMELFNYVYKDVTKRAERVQIEQHPQLIAAKKSYQSVIFVTK